MPLPPDPLGPLFAPDAPCDARWSERVRALSPEDRRRALAAADALAPAGKSGLARAVSTYAALAEDLDPASRPEDLERIRAVMAAAWAHADADALWRRAIARAPDPDVVLEASVLLGQSAMRRGDHAEAERLDRLVLAREGAATKRYARAAFTNFARLHLATDREVEALFLARAAGARMEAAGDLWGGTLARLHVCSVLAALGDWERLAGSLPEVEASARVLSEEARTRVAASVAGHRARLAVVRGDPETALAFVDEAERALARIGSGTIVPLVAERERVDAWIALGRFGEALSLLDRFAAERSCLDAPGWLLTARRVPCHLARREPREAANAAARVLEALEGDEGCRLGAGSRRRIALRLARDLWTATSPAAQDLAGRAWEAAAKASLERILELDRFVREWPDLAVPTRADLDLFADLRRRSLEEHAKMHEAVALLLRRAEDEGRSILPLFPAGGALVCVCAWCQRARTSDGLWLCVQQFLPLQAEGPIRLTHGICEDCHPRLAAELEAVVPNPRLA